MVPDSLHTKKRTRSKELLIRWISPGTNDSDFLWEIDGP